MLALVARPALHMLEKHSHSIPYIIYACNQIHPAGHEYHYVFYHVIPYTAVSSSPLDYSNSRLKESVVVGQHGVQQSFRIERLLSENAAEGEAACPMARGDSRKTDDWSVDREVDLRSTPPSGGPMKHLRSQSSAGKGVTVL